MTTEVACQGWLPVGEVDLGQLAPHLADEPARRRAKPRPWRCDRLAAGLALGLARQRRGHVGAGPAGCRLSARCGPSG